MGALVLDGAKFPMWVLVDDADLPRVWSRVWRINEGGYVRTGQVQMGRWLLGLQKGDRRQVDHANGNTLDNRRSNLRILTPAQNAQNRRHRGGSSPYRGVTWVGRRNRWQATCTVDGALNYLGSFVDELDAARAAQAFRQIHMPHVIEMDIPDSRTRRI